jgi:hypothetical protein
MPAVQPMLPLPRALPPARSHSPQPYRLPHDVRDRLQAALAPFRNREAAYELAVFLGRFWSMASRVALPFPIDRRALADRQDLGLTEARVRGAIRTLEAVGFLARAVTSGSGYKPTADGLRRKPIPFQFGADYAPLFIAANRRAAAVRDGDRRQVRLQGPESRERASVNAVGARSNLGFCSPQLAQRQGSSERSVLMGENTCDRPPAPFVPNANLEAALDRLKRAIGIAEAKRGGQS